MVLFNKVEKAYAGVGTFKCKPPTRSNIEFAARSQVAVNTCIPTYVTHHNTDVPCPNSIVSNSQPISRDVFLV